MMIVFVTTQSLIQPTLIGRIIPIAEELSKKGNEITLLIHGEQNITSPPRQNGGQAYEVGASIKTKITGKNPFTRTAIGKKRKRGIALVWLMLLNALRSALALIQIRPDVIVIVKPLPENVLAVLLARIALSKTKIVLDVDDFELFANVVSSLTQRSMLHWSERMACRLATHIIVATPFLGDHMQAVASQKKKVTLIPTGYSPSESLKPDTTGHVLAYIGSISESSGHLVGMLPDILRDVQKEVPDTTLMIAGAGDDEQMLKNRIHELGLDTAVTWFGRFKDTDIPGIISRSTVIIDPIDGSIVNRAKSSFRTMLACAAGMPVITSNIGIRTTIIPQQFHERFFAKPGDEASYAQVASTLLKNQLGDEDAAALREAHKKYSTEAIAQMYYTCIV